jgi:hypothetical protein
VEAPKQREIAEKILKRNPLYSNTVAEGWHLKSIINNAVETTKAGIELTR